VYASKSFQFVLIITFCRLPMQTMVNLVKYCTRFEEQMECTYLIDSVIVF